MEVLGLEAEGYLHQLRGDRYLEQALARLDALERAVLGTVAGQEPGSPAAIRAHAIVMQVYRLLGLPWRVESTYRRFSAAFGPGDAPRLWLERVAADKAYAAQTREWFRLLLTAAVSTLELRHPQDSSELANLRALQQTAYFPPRMLVPDLPVLQLPPLPDEELVRVEEGLAGLSALLPAGRARSVLRTWQVAAGQRLVRYRDSLAALAEIEPDDEALGILVGGLRGEARYRLANYEDACLDLRRAERTARAVLERTAPDPGAWGRPALDFLGRIAQKAGNALLVLGDDAAAQAAYDRAQEWLSDDPVARAGAALNRGNLAYLRNNLASERGYVTLDETLRQRMAVEGPQVLQAVKLARHVAGLTEAEGHYREALHCLSPLATSDGLAGELAAAANVNLGNTAWAWGAAMAAEGVERLDALPLAGDWSSTLVRPDFRAGDCYRAAIKLQRRALAAMPRTGSSDPAQEATAWSNLSELYYLLGEQTGAAAPLRKGVAAAGRALQGTDTAASALHPELAWRTRYNLARLYQAFQDLRGQVTLKALFFRHLPHPLHTCTPLQALEPLTGPGVTLLQEGEQIPLWELVAVLAEGAFDRLIAPVTRLAPPHLPVPHSLALETAFIPGETAIVEAASKLARIG